MHKAVALCLLTFGVCLGQLAPGAWKTDLSKKSIDLSELKSGGPPKDGIPAIDRPRFVSTSSAGAWLDAKEPVIVVEHENEARAYPLQILMWHEIVNDQIAGLPILVSYCPLCNSAVVFDRRIDGKAYDFGVSGMLRESDLVMYDRQTYALWQQITGEAIVGDMTGVRLELVTSQTVSFKAFSRAFPDGLVLSRDTGYARPYGKNPYVGYEFHDQTIMPVNPARKLKAPKDRLVTVARAGRTKAYPFPVLRKARVVEDSLDGAAYVVMYEKGTVTALDQSQIASSRDVGSVGVFSAGLDGQRLRFEKKGERIVDSNTGSSWNVLGMAVDGPLKGRRLRPVAHGVYFAFAWLVFHPDTEIVTEAIPAGSARTSRQSSAQ